MSQLQPLPNTKTAIETDVASAVEALRKLMVQPIKEELETLVADELHYGHSDADLEDKATFIETLISKKSDFLSIDLSEQTINVYNDTAVVRHILSADTFDDEIPRTIKLLILAVWHLQNGKWKIVARQAVKML